ncbi:MAG: hypothetical protein HUU10_02055 [Bacteroidetes bacterium]|nr:hypothetical protein [Bacteroidota bacterium]
MKTILSILFLCSLSSNLHAQAGVTAVPFLTISQSPQLTAVGSAGVAFQSSDPLMALQNPGQIHAFESDLSLRLSGYHSDWMPELSGDLFLDTKGLLVGYRLEGLSGLPVSVQLTLNEVYLDLGEDDEHNNTIGQFVSWERARTATVSLNYRWIADWSVGFSLSNVYSKLGRTESGKDKIADVNTTGFGVSTRLPIHEWFETERPSGSYAEYFITLGGSVINIGDMVHYVDENQKDPLPTQAKMGYSCLFRYHEKIRDQDFTLFEGQWTAEASDLLVKKKDSVTAVYDEWPGDLRVIDHVVMLQDGPRVRISQGYAFGLFETITVFGGRYDEDGYNGSVYSEGYELSSRGFFKLLSSYVDQPVLKQILLTTHVSWAQSKLSHKEAYHPLQDTRMSGLQLSTGFTF